MPHKKVALVDQFNQVSTTTGVGVSGAMVFGVSLENWVLYGTAVLVVCNLIITLPKALKSLREAMRSLNSAEEES